MLRQLYRLGPCFSCLVFMREVVGKRITPQYSVGITFTVTRRILRHYVCVSVICLLQNGCTQQFTSYIRKEEDATYLRLCSIFSQIISLLHIILWKNGICCGEKVNETFRYFMFQHTGGWNVVHPSEVQCIWTILPCLLRNLFISLLLIAARSSIIATRRRPRNNRLRIRQY